MKKVIVINGRGGVGKDTLCEFAAKRYKVMNISSITPIKELAMQIGRDGAKDLRSRKFLSDLKQLTSEYNDYPNNYLLRKCREFEKSEYELLFVHSRLAGGLFEDVGRRHEVHVIQPVYCRKCFRVPVQ